jgi:hypothetical protein
MAFPAFIVMITLTLCCQGGIPAPAAATDGCRTEAETKRLAKEGKIDGRIRIYREISDRYRNTMEQNFDQVQDLFVCWKELLTESLKDIEANINRKKKSGALIDFEIHVRKSINVVNDVRLKAPYQQNDNFEAWLIQANTVRKRFVDILFQR